MALLDREIFFNYTFLDAPRPPRASRNFVFQENEFLPRNLSAEIRALVPSEIELPTVLATMGHVESLWEVRTTLRGVNFQREP